MLVNGGEEIQRYWKFEQRFVFKCETVFQEWESPGLSSAAHLFLLFFRLPFTEIRFFITEVPRLSSSGCRGCNASFTIFVYRLIITKETQSGTPEAQGRHLQDGAGARPPRSYTTLLRFLLGFSGSLQIPGPCEFK